MSLFEKVLSKDGTNLGLEFKTEKHLYFFGSNNGTLDRLKHHYSDYTFAEIHQVHGEEFLQAKVAAKPDQADAHWTAEKNLALKVATADCIPLLVGGPEFIFAIHAGWRGVLLELPQKALLFAKQSLSRNLNQWSVLIGPHIRSKSFEVEASLGEKFGALGTQYQMSREEILSAHPEDSDKVLVDLEAVVVGQLISLGLAREQVTNLNYDTLTDLNYNSYRRDGQRAGRNVSFVARLN